LGLTFGYSFIFVSLFGIYKAFQIVEKLGLFLPSLSVLGLLWGSMLGSVCAVQQLFLRWIDKNAAKWGLIDKNDGELGALSEAKKYGDVVPFFALSFTLGWTLFEFMRGTIFLPFPWNFVCHLFNFENSVVAQVFTMGVAPCRYFLSTVWCLLIFSFFCDKSKFLKCISSAIMFATVVSGIFELRNAPEDPMKNFPVLYVDSDVDQADKINPENKEAILQKMIYLTKKAKKKAKVPPRLIVWPETAITHMITDENCEEIRRIREVAHEYLIFGADRIEKTKDGKVWHNSMFVVSKDKVEYVYDKVRLLPFGEYTPLRRFFETLAKKYGRGGTKSSSSTIGSIIESAFRQILNAIPKFFDGIDCTPGKTWEPVVTVGNLPPFTPYICSEIIFRTHQRSNARRSRAEGVIHISNTAWFSGTIKNQLHACSRATGFPPDTPENKS
jgi:apolipoprotein N-acyltransferase